MPRPQCCRRLAQTPSCSVFMPAGGPACRLEEVVLSLDVFEAIRLADLDCLYQEEAAARMNVSRQTFGRILESARKKVALVLMEGKSLRIEGGEVEMSKGRAFKCRDCQHAWELPFGGEGPDGCPNCRGTALCHVDGGRKDCSACQSQRKESGRKRCCHRSG